MKQIAIESTSKIMLPQEGDPDFCCSNKTNHGYYAVYLRTNNES